MIARRGDTPSTRDAESVPGSVRSLREVTRLLGASTAETTRTLAVIDGSRLGKAARRPRRRGRQRLRRPS